MLVSVSHSKTGTSLTPWGSVVRRVSFKQENITDGFQRYPSGRKRVAGGLELPQGGNSGHPRASDAQH